MSSSDILRFNVTKAATVISIVVTASALVWQASSANERLAAAEKRISTLEEKVQWQNDILWEMRGDLKVIRERKS